MKKFLRNTLALVLIFAITGTCFASSGEDEKIKWLIEKNIVEGRPISGSPEKDYALFENIHRAEFTKLIVYTIGKENLAAENKDKESKFKDVSKDYWANGYIQVAVSDYRDYSLMEGYPDGNFLPERNITYAEICAILVRAVKSDFNKDMMKNAIWPDTYLNFAKVQGILDGVEFSDANKSATRRDAFLMIYNAMNKKPSDSGKVEVDPATRGKSFDWIYNTMQTQGKVKNESKDLKIKPQYSISLGNGEATFFTNTNKDTSGMGIFQGGSESLILKFNERTWPYNEFRNVNVLDDGGKVLETSVNYQTLEITVKIPNLESVINGNNVTYKLELE